MNFVHNAFKGIIELTISFDPTPAATEAVAPGGSVGAVGGGSVGGGAAGDPLAVRVHAAKDLKNVTFLVTSPLHTHMHTRPVLYTLFVSSLPPFISFRFEVTS